MFGHGDYRSQDTPSPRGFSLLELLITLTILIIVFAVVVEGMVKMQQRNFAESSRVDATQQTRDFVDQMVRDIHTVGYPPTRLAAGNPNCANIVTVACGVIFFNSTQIKYEGDLDGTGTVYQVWLQLLPPASGNCPCLLQRGAITKQAALGGQQPTYFTEVNGVLNSGNGAGVATYPISLPGPTSYAAYATTDVFNAYDQNAVPYGPCVDANTCSGVRSLQIAVNVAPNFLDVSSKSYPVISITSKARLNN
jgi:prepilin-type N-terminal cleavage/methylation domain-containing protein